mmetsp:Transcript_47066/g.121683  ORF Transcript_47066/g.121683 Transcript_47066/m.121683 type:complete len:375 (-) Transcript_47066:89-1213(-)
MDPQLQQALLQDPAVQEAVRKAGQDALSDPTVQRAIINTCRQKFPEYAAHGARMVSEWAQDPEVQRQACQYAGVAALYAGQVGEQFVGLIEQGPAGLRLLAFGGGVACVVMAGRTVLNPASLAHGPLMYVLALYLTMFSLTTMLFEADQAWIAKVPRLDVYQNLVLDKAKFVAEAYGRGLVYGFEGTLWLSLYGSITSPLELALGLYFLGLSVLHILMHFGVMPQHVARKLREGGAAAAGMASRNGYVQLPLNPPTMDHQGFDPHIAAAPKATPEALSAAAQQQSLPFSANGLVRAASNVAVDKLANSLGISGSRGNTGRGEESHRSAKEAKGLSARLSGQDALPSFRAGGRGPPSTREVVDPKAGKQSCCSLM